MRDLRRGVDKVRRAIASSPNPDLRTALNGYSTKEMVRIFLEYHRADLSRRSRASPSAKADRQLQFGFMAATTPTPCQAS